ncbi:uncharacterized protein [Dendrobates tinctorius]|uniref:uncharacterized protein n=1 Tax=Dendrobates tinctorius TaxID=92724 RepID=UPI003CCA4367
MAACISPKAGRFTGSVIEDCTAMAARVCYVLLLSVLLAAAVSPGRAAPVDTPDVETLREWKVVEVDQSADMANMMVAEENALTGLQNDTQLESQPEAQTVRADGTNVNITQEVEDYDGKAEDEQEYKSEEPWWEEEDDWMETDSVVKEVKEDGDSKAEKPLWETWWEVVPKTERPPWDVEAVDVKPWLREEGVVDKPQDWGKVDGKAQNKLDEALWWAWPVTMKPWWGAETKAERPLWEEREKAEEPWWKVDAELSIPQDSKWFPTKKQDEAKQRMEDPYEYDSLDVYIDNDVDTGDVIEEIPVQKEIFPPEMKGHRDFHEKSGSVYFWAFLVTLAILVAVLYMVYHKKRLSQQKRFIFALEGGLFGDKKRPNSGEYQKLDNKI